MFGLDLARLLPLDAARSHLDARLVRYGALAVAAVLAILALVHLADALRFGLMTRLPPWQASLLVALAILVVGALVAWFGHLAAKRHERRAAAAALASRLEADQLMQLALPAVDHFLHKNPRQLVVLSLAAGVLFEYLKNKKPK